MIVHFKATSIRTIVIGMNDVYLSIKPLKNITFKLEK